MMNNTIGPEVKCWVYKITKKVDRLQALQGFQLFRQSGSFAFVINNGLCSTHSLLLPKKREKYNLGRLVNIEGNCPFYIKFDQVYLGVYKNTYVYK